MLVAETTTAPSADWAAQKPRQLTPFGQGPKFLLRHHDAIPAGPTKASGSAVLTRSMARLMLRGGLLRGM